MLNGLLDNIIVYSAYRKAWLVKEVQMKIWKKLLIGLILVCVWLVLPVFPPCAWLPYAVQGVIVVLGVGLIIMIIMRI